MNYDLKALSSDLHTFGKESGLNTEQNERLRDLADKAYFLGFAHGNFTLATAGEEE